MSPILGKFLRFGTITAALLLAACGGGGGGGASVQDSGTMQWSITDAPACGFDAVNVTVAKVRVHQSAAANENDAGWVDLTLSPPRRINLVTLVNGVLQNLGQAPLPAGHYQQVRLVLSANSGGPPFANSVVASGASEVALDTPSAMQSGIKLLFDFDVAANSLADMALDFDACKSVVTRGNGSYSLKPVISVVPMSVGGSISGVLDATLSSSHPMVTAQLNGTVVKSTIPDPATGSFTLSPLLQSSTAGNYTVVITADNHAAEVIGGVPVTAKTNTAVSAASSPITLPGSSMSVVSGNVAPVSAEASLRAMQTYALGPTTATINSQSADLATGAYAMSLPTTATEFGVYGTGALPILTVSQVATSKTYAIEASATGFQTQTTTVVLLSPSVIVNFTLQ